MGRASKQIEALGLPPLREWWRQINHDERQAKAEERAKRKNRDKRRRKCRCEAYPWPHRPGGGLCRWPEPPLQRWQPKAYCSYRPYCKRYTGILRQLARTNSLHPIRDRALIQALMPRKLELAKELKAKHPR